MPNYGKYYIAVRLLLLKQYLEANAGKDRIVPRRELEEMLKEHDMPVEKKKPVRSRAKSNALREMNPLPQ